MGVTVTSVQVVDVSGDVASVNFYWPDTASQAAIQSAMDTVMVALDAITGAKITSATITLPLQLAPGLKAAAVDNHDVEKGGNLGFDVQDSAYRHTTRIPAILGAVINDDAVILNNAAVEAFETAMVAGDGITRPTNRFEQQLLDLISGTVTFRKS